MLLALAIVATTISYQPSVLAQLSASVTPGTEFEAGDRITLQRLNLLGTPTVEITGTVLGNTLATNAVSSVNVNTNVFDQATIKGGAGTAAYLASIGTNLVYATNIVDIPTNSVASTNVVDGTITGTDLATNTVTGANLATNTVTAANLLTNAFTNLTVVTPATNDLVLLMDASASSNTVAATMASLQSSMLFEPLWTTNGISIDGGTQPVLEVAHGLGRAPYMVQGWLVCITNDHGYVVGDMVQSSAVGFGIGLGTYVDIPGIVISATATNIAAIVPAGAGAGMLVIGKTGQIETYYINRAHWTLTVYAW